MTNRELIEKSFTDMSRQEKADAVALAKNLLEIILRGCSEEEKKAVLDGVGTWNIPSRMMR